MKKFAIGQKVKVQWNSYWTKATIVDIVKNMYIVRIRFPGSEPFEALLSEAVIRKG